MSDAYGGSDAFDWDLEKAALNVRKHGVSFEEAMSVFRDPFSLTVSDTAHSDLEDRLILMGLSDRHRLLVIVYVERENHLRLISARVANPDERRKYEEGTIYGF